MEKDGKTVKMTEVKKEKLSYDELEKFAFQLSEQAKSMKQAIAERDNEIKRLTNHIEAVSGAFTRLQFLIEIVKMSDKFDSDFIVSCTDEIKSIMEIKEDKNNDGVQAD